MTKVRLNLDPKDPITFTGTVPIPTPDGKKLAIEWVFKHRTRAEMGEWIDDTIAKAKADAESTKDEKPKSVSQSLREQTERDVESVMDVAEGWGVEGLDFNEENLARFFDLYPGAANAVLEHYRISVTQGRLGN